MTADLLSCLSQRVLLQEGKPPSEEQVGDRPPLYSKPASPKASVPGLSRCLAPSGDEELPGSLPFPLLVESTPAEWRTGKLRAPRDPHPRLSTCVSVLGSSSVSLRPPSKQQFL